MGLLLRGKMFIETPISLGELCDKISILRIKKNKITDQKKQELIQNELAILENKIDLLNLKNIKIKIHELQKINLKLWEIEDEIREHEKNNDFGEIFISLARLVYLTNDKRFLMKKKINEEYGSKIQEVKSYNNESGY